MHAEGKKTTYAIMNVTLKPTDCMARAGITPRPSKPWYPSNINLKATTGRHLIISYYTSSWSVKSEATWTLNAIKVTVRARQYTRVYADISLSHLFARGTSCLPIALPINEHADMLKPRGTMKMKAVIVVRTTNAA